MFSSSHLKTIRANPNFRNNLFNTSKKYLFNIFCKIYYTNRGYQYYKTTDTNDAKICNFKV